MQGAGEKKQGSRVQGRSFFPIPTPYSPLPTLHSLLSTPYSLTSTLLRPNASG
ncbi:hypothetical protein NSP_12870 [Nodularia spumigena CCY9414]|nr:hypothetical protein NSP_12870 [Nodularia spumigena CCY9414]